MFTRRALLTGFAAATIASEGSQAMGSAGAASNVRRVTVNFATNRRRLADGSFGGDPLEAGQRPDFYYLGTADVDHVGQGLGGWEMGEVRVSGDPAFGDRNGARHASAAHAAPDIDEFIRNLGRTHALRSAAPDSTIIYIHGFKTTFKTAMESAASIASSYDVPHVYAFSWPSYGELLGYWDDRRNAYGSGASAATFFDKMLCAATLSMLDAQRPRLHFVSHSMGARVISAAVQALYARNAEHAAALLSRTYFQHAILAAADEDYNALSEPTKLAPLLTLAREIDIYTNHDDFAMTLSTIANVGRIPMGRDGPAIFAALAQGPLRNVNHILCDGFGAGDAQDDLVQHSYYMTSSHVTNDIRQVLAGLSPDRVQPRYSDDGVLRNREFRLLKPDPS